MHVCVCVCVCVCMWSRDRCDSSGSDQSHGVMKPIEDNKIQKNTHTSRRGRLTLTDGKGGAPGI